MSCSVNNVKKYIVYIRPGCFFRNADGTANSYFTSGDAGLGMPKLQDRYIRNATPNTFFSNVSTFIPFPDFISVDFDPTAGEKDVIEIPVQDRKAKNSNGIRTLPDLEMTLKVDSSLDINNTNPDFFHFFADWWQFSNLWNFDIMIMITNRGYQHLYGYLYTDVAMARFGDESMSIEDVKRAQIKMKFYPDDAILVDRCGNPFASNKTNRIPDNFTC